jgi:hypothetical protein
MSRPLALHPLHYSQLINDIIISIFLYSLGRTTKVKLRAILGKEVNKNKNIEK